MPSSGARRFQAKLSLGAVLVAWACSPPSGVTNGDDTSSGASGGTGNRSHGGGGGKGGSSGTATGGSTLGNGGTALASGGSGGSLPTSGTGPGAGDGGRNTSGAGGATAGRASNGGSAGTAAAGGASGTGGDASGGGMPGGGMPGGGTSSAGTGAAGVPNDPNWKPPDMTATAELIVYSQATQTATSSTDIRCTITLKNQTDAAFDLGDVTVRYWLSSEPPPRISVFYMAVQINTPEFVGNNSNSYIEFAYKKGVTIPVYASADSLQQTQVQLGVDSTIGGQKFNQANDWSFDPSSGSKPNPKITAYKAGKLIWGCEPSHECANQQPTGEAGAGGQAAN